MREELIREIEGAIALMKAGIDQSSAGVNFLAAKESAALEEGLDKETLEDIKKSLDDAARRLRQFKQAEKVLHQKIKNAIPAAPDGPVVMIGT